MSLTWAVDAALAPIGLLAALAAVDHPAALLLVLPLAGLLRTFARERRARVDHAFERSHAYRGTALLLGDVVEATTLTPACTARTWSRSRSPSRRSSGWTPAGGATRSSSRCCTTSARSEFRTRSSTSPGHSRAEAGPDVETHTVIGEEMLDRVGGVLGNVGHLVRSCHERYGGGGGYPDGLIGEDIPLVARIVCCCDAYSAITTDRPYRAGRSAEEALEELRRCAGAQFDPDVVEALAGVVATPA